MRHPRQMSLADVEAYLTMLANERQVSPSTHHQALNALFDYRDILCLGGDDPPLQRITRRQAVLRVSGFVLLLRPGRLHQAQGGIQRVAAGVVGQAPQQGVAGD